MKSGIKMGKVWEDQDFFELCFEFNNTSCAMEIYIYSSNEELRQLRQGIIDFSHSGEDFIWVSGEDNEHTTHFLSLRAFKLNNRGHVAFEVLADNKLELPEKVKANFCIVTVIGQLDDFSRKLQMLIDDELSELEGLFPE